MTLPDLTFRQVADKVKFSVLLMCRRQEDPDEALPFTFFTYDRSVGVTMTPISDTFFTSDESRTELAYINLPTLVSDRRALFAFISLSAEYTPVPDVGHSPGGLTRAYEGSPQYSLPREEAAFVHGISHVGDKEVWRAPLTRRKFGNPILGKWESIGQSFEYTDPLMMPSLRRITGKSKPGENSD